MRWAPRGCAQYLIYIWVSAPRNTLSLPHSPNFEMDQTRILLPVLILTSNIFSLLTGLGGTKYISFEERQWHNDCFNCKKCSLSLVGRGFLTERDDILCPDCGKDIWSQCKSLLVIHTDLYIFFLNQAILCSGFHWSRRDFPLVLLSDIHVCLNPSVLCTRSVPEEEKTTRMSTLGGKTVLNFWNRARQIQV